MLDKIKVYNRKTSEIENNMVFATFQGKPCLCFMSLDIIPIQMRCHHIANVIFLEKTDPRGKFKKEMEGWWFCNEYVVIQNEIVFDITYYNYQGSTDWDEKTTGRSLFQQDLWCSEFFINGDCPRKLWKYENRGSDIKNYNININREFSSLEIDSLIKELQNKKQNLEDAINPEYKILKSKLEEFLSIKLLHNDRLTISYSKLLEDKYIAILELIND